MGAENQQAQTRPQFVEKPNSYKILSKFYSLKNMVEAFIFDVPISMPLLIIENLSSI